MPIIVNENFVVLDGHQRLRACNELGITPAYDMTTFPSRLDEKSFVIKTNLVRRQMKKIDRIQAVCNLEAIEKEKAKARQLAPLLRGSKPPLARNCADHRESIIGIANTLSDVTRIIGASMTKSP